MWCVVCVVSDGDFEENQSIDFLLDGSLPSETNMTHKRVNSNSTAILPSESQLLCPQVRSSWCCCCQCCYLLLLVVLWLLLLFLCCCCCCFVASVVVVASVLLLLLLLQLGFFCCSCFVFVVAGVVANAIVVRSSDNALVSLQSHTSRCCLTVISRLNTPTLAKSDTSLVLPMCTRLESTPRTAPGITTSRKLTEATFS